MDHTTTGSGHLIDHCLPSWQFRELHTRRIPSSAGAVMDALLALTPRGVPVSGFLLGLRLAPAAIASRRWPIPPDRPWMEVLQDLGFIEMGRTTDEIAFGAIGKFWRIREELVPLPDAEAFRIFDQQGFAKGAMDFRVTTQGDSVTLSTETRVWATDEQALRRFRPYWIPVRIFGGLIRRELLASVARHAVKTFAPA